MDTFLLGIDGSEASERIVDYCGNIFDPEKHSFLAANIVPVIPDEVKDEVWQFETSMGDKGVYEMESEMLEHAEALVVDAVQPLEDVGFDVRVETKLGHPGSELCDLADVNNVEGIVVGRRGQGIVSEMVLGSVSNHVIHHSTVPVTVVPAPEES